MSSDEGIVVAIFIVFVMFIGALECVSQARKAKKVDKDGKETRDYVKTVGYSIASIILFSPTVVGIIMVISSATKKEGVRSR